MSIQLEFVYPRTRFLNITLPGYMSKVKKAASFRMFARERLVIIFNRSSSALSFRVQLLSCHFSAIYKLVLLMNLRALRSTGMFTVKILPGVEHIREVHICVS